MEELGELITADEVIQRIPNLVEVARGIPKLDEAARERDDRQKVFAKDFTTQLMDGVFATLQRILGHSKVETTMIYTHIADRAVVDSYRKHGPRANNWQI